MDLQITTYQFGERPDVTKPDPEFYKAMGEAGIRDMVSRHYDLLQNSSISNLFPSDNEAFDAAKRNSADFMIQICGGPDYYNQHRGNPMLIKRHAPFTISHEARMVWLECYRQALVNIDIPQELILSFWNYIQIFSMWMVNSETK